MNQTIYPIGIQNFEKIRKDGYLYIDKPISKGKRSCSRDWPWRNWKRTGKNTRSSILT